MRAGQGESGLGDFTESLIEDGGTLNATVYLEGIQISEHGLNGDLNSSTRVLLSHGFLSFDY